MLVRVGPCSTRSQLIAIIELALIPGENFKGEDAKKHALKYSESKTKTSSNSLDKAKSMLHLINTSLPRAGKIYIKRRKKEEDSFKKS
jgi:hypothetical protein